MEDAAIGEAFAALLNIENEKDISLAYLRGSLHNLSKPALAEIVQLACEI